MAQRVREPEIEAMKAFLNKAWKILTIVAVSCSFVSCELMQREFERSEDVKPPENRGALIIRISTGGPTAATLTPPISMEIASFNIYGDGPDPDSFEYLDTQEVELSESDLTPGEWTIRVEALNSAGITIGEGETTVIISPNLVATAQIEVEPIADPDNLGTLYLMVEWPKKTLADPTLVSSLKAAGSTTEITMPFVKKPTENNPKYFELNPLLSLPAGYYTLTLRLFEVGEPIWGTVEAVRILDGQATSQVYQAD